MQMDPFEIDSFPLGRIPLRSVQVLIPALCLIGCMVLGKLLNFSQFLFKPTLAWFQSLTESSHTILPLTCRWEDVFCWLYHGFPYGTVERNWDNE